ncbi:hypothetical protein MuYL_0479 [Mucilaginibacter xinganensis]|uniref:Uncharacterized protein n=1 Tax=Mucilaginibacter xinganensis TaxID=1234841 RepID=A0A223NR48_9SPHI|nr:hypothetical protein MuYL_0479 [Mucilaginibacter xinganensis]
MGRNVGGHWFYLTLNKTEERNKNGKALFLYCHLFSFTFFKAELITANEKLFKNY